MANAPIQPFPSIQIPAVTDKGLLTPAWWQLLLNLWTKNDSEQNQVYVPSGGSTGQVLKKNSNSNFDTGWEGPLAAVALSGNAFELKQSGAGLLGNSGGNSVQLITVGTGLSLINNVLKNTQAQNWTTQGSVLGTQGGWVLGPNKEVVAMPVGGGYALPTNLSNSIFSTLVASTATVVFNLTQNGTTFGTVTFAAGSLTGTVASIQTTFSSGDIFAIAFPGSADATFNTLAYLILGTRP